MEEMEAGNAPMGRRGVEFKYLVLGMQLNP